jgi:cyclic pyranopterin phosphate synthase
MSALAPALLEDQYGRVAADLRVSLTDRCNLRCQYCMPAEGLDWMATEQTLTDDEVVRLIGIAVEHLGIDRSASPAASRCCVVDSWTS